MNHHDHSGHARGVAGHIAHAAPEPVPAGHGPSMAPSPEAHAHEAHGGRHQGHSIADFRRRFWLSLVLTIPVVLLSPLIQQWLGLGERLRFRGDQLLLFLCASAVFLYGGWPFLVGLGRELRARRPGMMTLVGMAITTAYVYSSLVVFRLPGEGFFWELATLVDIMLLGHWIEMRSVMGASGALEALVRLMPAEAHGRRPDGSTEDVPVGALDGRTVAA